MDRVELLERLSDETRAHIDRIRDMYNAPFARQMGIKVECIGFDRVVCTMDLREEHMNSMGRGHGGAVFSLMDHTFAFATNIDDDCTGIETSISYHRPAMGRLKATATPLNISRSLRHFQVMVEDEAGKLVASGKCISFVLKRD
jgi:acyl-CoA thioesterase